LLGVT